MGDVGVDTWQQAELPLEGEQLRQRKRTRSTDLGPARHVVFLLPNSQAEALWAEAERRNVAVSLLIREAVSDWLKRHNLIDSGNGSVA